MTERRPAMTAATSGSSFADRRWQFEGSLEVLSESGCFFYLESRKLGRIAFDVGGRPEILPINYGMVGRMVVFRTGPGTKLDVVPHAPVAFEVDSWEPELGTGWSVVVKGRAEEVTFNPGRTAVHLRRAEVHPAAPGARWHWFAIRPAEVSGRSFQVRPHSAQERA